MKASEFITEKWTQKYKSSINCSHPKGFSQKAHCAGKKKNNESIEMEMTCPDCGMCQTHGNLNEIKKGQKDSNGFTRCWPGKHAVGTKKGKNGGQVRNCVPNESQGVAENYHSDLMKQTYAKFFKPAPPQTVSAVKKFLSDIIISLGTAQDNDYDEEEPEEINWEQDLSDVREAYSKLRSNSSPNWFDIADAVLSYDTEFRESMIEWAEETLGNELVDFLWDEVWEAKNQISRSDGSYNIDVGAGQEVKTHEWKVMINDQQETTLGGLESADAAMKVALRWAQNNGFEREVQAGKIKVVQVQQGVAEGKEKRCMQCGMTNCSCKPGTCKCKPVAGWIPNKGFKKAIEEAMLAEKFDADQQFDIIEEMVEALAEAHGVDAEQIWEDFESVDDHELLDESAAWHRKAGKSKTGGLNDKGIASYRREHPGSKLQKAVTTKPSKLKPGSKAAKRRKSFCARMGGVDGPMKKPNGKPTRKALALRKWNC